MRRRLLGQHYLVDETVIAKVISSADINKDEVVLEIGTGKGALTARLTKLGSRVEGYEVDRLNAETTRSRVSDSNFRLHLADAFKERPYFDVLISSLPYSRSADFVEWLSQVYYSRAIVILQEDFVRKITSPPGTRQYRALSVIAQASSRIKLGDSVPRSAFNPPPKVLSRIVEFGPRTRLDRIELYLIKKMFSLRRRTLGSVIGHLGTRKLQYERRVYTLTPDEVLSIVRGIKNDQLFEGVSF